MKIVAIGAVLVVVVLAASVTVAQQTSLPEAPPPRGDAPAKAATLFPGLALKDAAPVSPEYRARAVAALGSLNPDLDQSTFRLLSKVKEGSSDVEVYAEAGTSTICSITRYSTASGPLGSSGCGQAIDSDGNPIVHGSLTVAPDDETLVTVLVPAGVSGLRLAFADGSQQALVPDNGVAVYLGTLAPDRLTYTLPNGTSKSDEYQLPTQPPA